MRDCRLFLILLIPVSQARSEADSMLMASGQAYMQSCEDLRETGSLDRFSGLKGIGEKAAALSRTDGFIYYNFAPHWSSYLKSQAGKEALEHLRQTLKGSRYRFSLLETEQGVLQQAWRVPWFIEARGENDDPGSIYSRKFREAISIQRYRMWMEVLQLYNGDIRRLNELSDAYWEVGNICSSFSGWMAQPGGLEALNGRERHRWSSLSEAIGGFKDVRGKIDHALTARLFGGEGGRYQARIMNSRSRVLRLDHSLIKLLRQNMVSPAIP